MQKPIVGVMPLVDRERESLWMLPGYMEGIMQAGGVPVMLPLTGNLDILKRAAEMCSSFLFTGGQDVSPSMYGEESLPTCGETSPARDGMEKEIFALAVEAEKPVLGICRGIQLINVLMGGTLYQDLPTQMPSTVEHHQIPPYDRPVHEVYIERGTPLYSLLERDSLAVNSYHHQGIKKLATGLRTMATAPDGLIEAVYAPGKRYLWAFQWHPEFSFLRDDVSREIFRSFINASAD